MVDVDHTLFDWLRVWATTARTLLARAEALTGVPRDQVLDELGALHRRIGAPEVDAPLSQLPSMQAWHRDDPSRMEALHAAWQAAEAAGDAVLVPYPGVDALLTSVHDAGTRIVACSETAPARVWRRLVRLGLAPRIHALASPTRPAAPLAVDVIETHASKPDPEVLRVVCRTCQVLPQEATCVGDHLHKDVLMAQAAGVHDVWARYGTERDPEALALLDRLRHWTSATVDTDRFGAPPEPTHTLEHSLLELRDLFDFASSG